MKRLLACCIFLLCASTVAAQYTRQDTLRGSNGWGRDWWDVLKYNLSVEFDTARQIITGYNIITFRVTDESRDSMQIDLQDGLALKGVRQHGKDLAFTRDGNVYWISKPKTGWEKGQTYAITLNFKGAPRKAANPPWDGGFIWAKDSMGKPWIAVACQGIGASSWWPCKDYQGDEPDSGMSLNYSLGINLPGEEANLNCISNGRLSNYDTEDPTNGNKYINYLVRNPINSYNASFYIGDYAHWHDTLRGEKGVLDLDFYPLKYNEKKARKQWAVTKDMLRCFEYWLGPYPFYEDGYKLVEAPYLGMEHQSAVAYGNEYKMGYRGRDLTGTGIGLSFDFIVVHESGHEWFGNNITAQDIADNWLHEGITCYTEVLFVEWILGKDSAFKYASGQWSGSKALGSAIGHYGVNDGISSVMYAKGSAVVHMIRLMVHDDQKFRQLLRKLNSDFYHQTVTSRQVEDSISHFIGMDLKRFFNHYLRNAKLPTVLAKQNGASITLSMPYQDIDEAFKLPIYDRNGKFICELSRKPVTIPTKDLSALQNYLIAYVPKDSGTIAWPNK